jgi:hypothetical protein
MNPVPGRGLGLGWGRGWGGSWGRGWRWRHWYHATGLPGWVRFGHAPFWGIPPVAEYGPYTAPPTPEQEVEFLKSQSEWLKEQLEAIGQRIEELEREE